MDSEHEGRYTDKERIRDLERRVMSHETAKALFYLTLLCAGLYLAVSGKLAKIFEDAPASG